MATYKQSAVEMFNVAARPIGCEISRSLPDTPGRYVENTEIGSENFVEKLARLERGEPFEWPNMVALNRALAQFIAPARSVVNIGAGTGTFEWLASLDSSVEFVASEFDRQCVDWCRAHRQRPNVEYCDETMARLLDRDGGFELAVCVDVVEHVADYATFLSEFSALAPRAILTTPNKARSPGSLFAMPPVYPQHVREWTAGEFYWVLRLYYANVQILTLDDPVTGSCREIGPDSTRTPLIAICERPTRVAASSLPKSSSTDC